MPAIAESIGFDGACLEFDDSNGIVFARGRLRRLSDLTLLGYESDRRLASLQRPDTMKLRLPLLAAGLFATLPSQAEQLDAINITATRTARTADQTLASVSVITRSDIDSSQALDVADLLRERAGITLANSGGRGKATSLFLRGTGGGHVLLLIDGQRIGSATLGSPAWELLPLAQIERIEVVRGPRAQLYGSDAIGGVIQIFTRQGEPGQHWDAHLGYGTYHSADGDIGVSGGDEHSRYSARIGYTSSTGFDATIHANVDADGYDNHSFSGSFSHRFDNQMELTLNAMQASGNTEYDGFGDVDDDYDADFKEQVLGARFSVPLSDHWDSLLSLGENRDEQYNQVNGHGDSVFKTKRWQATWQNDFDLGNDTLLTAGLDFHRDQIDSTTEYAETRRDNRALFAQYQTTWNTLDLNLGLRYDDNEAFGGHATGSIAAGYHFNNGMRLMASYGTAFKAPSFNDLYFVSPFGSNGNPDLAPETSNTFEVGLSGKAAFGHWSLDAYRTDIEDLIQWIDTGGFIFQPRNIGRARIDGLEASTQGKIAGWRYDAALTLLDPSDENSGKILPRRSKRSLRIDLDKRFGAFELGATLTARSKSFDNPDNSVSNAGYGLLDLRGAWHLTPDWSLRGSIHNVFDRDYHTSANFNQPGAELFISINYQPKH